ncbi:Ig-like domain-containing protein [Neptunomonas sp.]|uniref:Ig-like domain-containing protein n=1 Tax=Neptunomonas sp. TaxID=1971898 RepID=UPI0025FE5C1A|nr:Ig-like domain-containing protein [Neptunomonas sp.]
MAIYVLREVMKNGVSVVHSLADASSLPATAGSIYTLIEKASQEPVGDVVLKRKGRLLEVEVDQNTIVRIEGFFGDQVAATFSVDGSLAVSEDMSVSSTDAATVAASDAKGDIVWQASEAQGFGMLAGMGAGVGALALAAGGGGSSAVVASSSYLLTIVGVAGPFSSEALVEVYGQNGALLTTGTFVVEAGTVQFTITNGYVGPVLVKVIDNNEGAPDFIDETTGTGTSLDTTLRAMGYADGTGNVTITVSPVTELAVRQAGIVGNIVTEADLAMNAKVAELFGIEDILSPAITVLDSTYNPDDGLSAAEHYGNVLAMLSGASASGVNALLTHLKAQLTESDDVLVFNQAGVDALVAGVETFNSGANQSQADPISALPFIDKISPIITSVTLSNTSLKVGDTATLTITFSEAITDFDNSDISLPNGALSAVSSSDGGITWSGGFTPTADIEDVTNIITVGTSLTDLTGNAPETSKASDNFAIDTAEPVISAVTVPNAAMSVGDAVAVTITASEAGLSLTSGTINGVAVTGFTDNGDGNYSATYTVVEGDVDREAGDDIPVSFVLQDDAGNTSSTFSTAISQAGDSIDANPTPSPSISAVSIPNVAMSIGDIVTVTITASEAGLSLISGTINGVAVTGFTDNGDGNYSATYTVVQGQKVRAGGDDIPVFFVLQDGAGNTSSTFTTAISQASDAIDASIPAPPPIPASVISAASIPDTGMNVADVVTVTLTVADDGGNAYTGLSGTVGGFALSNLNRTNSTTYTAQFTVANGGTDVAAGANIPVSITLGVGAAFSTAISQASDEIDANIPVLNSVIPADDVTNTGVNDNLTLTFSEAVSVGTGNLLIKRVGDDSTFETVDITSGKVTGWGTAIITVNPAGTFTDSTAYYVQLPTGAILDSAGNSTSAIADKTTWNFATPDTIAPQIESFSTTTVDGSYKSGSTINITATVDEPIQSGNTITVTLDTGDSVLLTAAANGTTLVGTYTVGAGDTSSDLKVNSFTIGTVEDLSGNAMVSTTVPMGNNISDAKAIIVDTTSPTNKVSGIDISADTGTSAADFLTKTASQTITATLDSTLAVGEKLFGSTDGGTTWADISSKVTGTAVSWNGATLSGASSIQIKVTDTAGNEGSNVGVSYTLDQIAPTTTITGIDISADTGISANDFLTKTASQTITGTLSTTLAAGEILYGSVDGGSNWTDITSKISGGTSISWDSATLSGSSTIQMKVVDAAGNDGSAASQAFTLDTTAPTVTYTSVSYASGSDTITLTGTNINTLLDGSETSGTDLKSKFDWSKFKWDINGDDAVTGDVLFSASDILSVKALNNTTLEVVLTSAKGTALEATGDWDALNTNDSVEISVGFSRDGAENISSTDAFEGPTYIPTVSSVAISGSTGILNNTLNTGDTVSVTVSMSENTDVNTIGGTPYINLNIGGSTVQAGYATGTGSTALVFTYTILANEADADGISIDLNSINPNSGTIKGATGNNAVITHSAVSANASYKVDAVTPSTPGLSLNTDTGTSNTDRISSDETVDVGSIEAGASWEYSLNNGSNWANGTGTSFELTANTTFASGHIQVRQADAAGNVSTNGTLGAVKTDSNVPTVSSVSVPANQTYKIGENLDFTVNFNEDVTLVGTSSTLALTLGTGGTVQAAYQSKTANSITYRYTVQSGTEDTNGISLGALTLNMDTVKDIAGNTANLTLNNPGATTSVLIDGIKPGIASVTVENGTHKIGDTVTVTITAAGNETGLTLSGKTFNGQTLTGITDNNNGTYTTTYTVVEGDAGVADAGSVTTSLAFTDAAGNIGDTTTSVTLSGESIDADTPDFASSTPADEATGIAVDSNIVINFDENIALGTGNIVISDGTDTKTINVASHAGQLSISNSQLTINPTADLSNNGSTYNVKVDSTAIVDAAGNTYAGISDSTTLNFDTVSAVDTTKVVFDLKNGKSSTHSTGFSAGVSYTIYIYIDSDSKSITLPGGSKYTGGANLGADDTIILAGDAPGGVQGAKGNPITKTSVDATNIRWSSAGHGLGETITNGGNFFIVSLPGATSFTDTASLWSGNWGARPAYNYTAVMPAGILSSQIS